MLDLDKSKVEILTRARYMLESGMEYIFAVRGIFLIRRGYEDGDVYAYLYADQGVMFCVFELYPAEDGSPSTRVVKSPTLDSDLRKAIVRHALMGLGIYNEHGEIQHVYGILCGDVWYKDIAVQMYREEDGMPIFQAETPSKQFIPFEGEPFKVFTNKELMFSALVEGLPTFSAEKPKITITDNNEDVILELKDGDEIDIGSLGIPIEYPIWADWQTCDEEPNKPHWHIHAHDGVPEQCRRNANDAKKGETGVETV